MWWLQLKGMLSGATIKYLAAGAVIIAVISGIFFLGYTQGQDRGFNNAYGEFKNDVQELNRSWQNAVQERDTKINQTISNQFNILDEQIQDYIRNDNRERELIQRLDVLSSTLQEMRDETQDTDFGECTFSPEFERLLNAARDAISAGNSNRTAGPSDSARQAP